MLLGLSLLLLGWREGLCLHPLGASSRGGFPRSPGSALCRCWVTVVVPAPAVVVPLWGSSGRSLLRVAVPDAKPPSGFI